MKLDPPESGTVIVRIWVDEPIKEEARTAALKDARKAVDENLKEDGPLAVKHLNTVVTKLSVFAGVVDAAADVRPSLTHDIPGGLMCCPRYIPT